MPPFGPPLPVIWQSVIKPPLIQSMALRASSPRPTPVTIELLSVPPTTTAPPATSERKEWQELIIQFWTVAPTRKTPPPPLSSETPPDIVNPSTTATELEAHRQRTLSCPFK